MTGYYDIILGLIPFTLVGISGILHLAGVQTTVAVPVAATVAVALIGHAMFINGPVDSSPSQPQHQSQPQSRTPSNSPPINSAD